MRGEEGVLQVADGLGLSNLLLRVYDDFTDRSVTKIETNLDIEESGETPTVVFSLLPKYSNFTRRVGVLGYFFKQFGFHPLAIYNDDTLSSVLMGTVDEPMSTKGEIANKYRVSRITEMFGVEKWELRDVQRNAATLSRGEVIDTEFYRDINIARYAEASTRKYLKRYTVDLDDPDQFDIYSVFLADAMYLTDVFERVVETEDVYRIIVQEPNYIQGGIPASVGLKRDIPVYTIGQGKKPNSLMFGRGSNASPMQIFTDEGVVRAVLDEPLNQRELDDIETVVNQRKSGTNVRRQYTPTNTVGVDHEGDFTVGVFTNLLWDGTLEPDDGAYTNAYNWMRETIDTLSETDVECIVKIHPAESKLGTNEGMESWIDSTYRSLPENVSVLPPDTDVNTYQMINQIDAGIVYSTTTGLEMALEGLPVIVGGLPHYRGFRITFDPETKDEYRELLRNITTLEQSEESNTRAWRYAHLFFIRKELEFPLEKLEEKVLVDDGYLNEELADIRYAVEKMVANEAVLKSSPD